MGIYLKVRAAVVLVGSLATGACSSNGNPGSSANTGGSTSAGGGGSTGGGTSVGGGTGASCHPAGTLTVTNQGMTAYLIDGTANPTLTLCRGNTYTFAVAATGHPFYINSVQGVGTTNAYNDGVSNNGTDSGNVTFVVGASAPNQLFYNCSIHAAMTGTINIVN